MSEQKTKCPKCNDTGTIRVLGGGGDYEDWPCPKCQPERHIHSTCGVYDDGEGNE